MLASTGLSAVLLAYPGTLTAIRVVGGAYLVYLGGRAAKSAIYGKAISVAATVPLSRSEFGMLYRQGILVHVVNPKSIMAWVATISLGLHPGAPAYMPFIIMLGCAALSVVIFGGYAVAFSFPAMSRLYARAQRWIDGALAIFFIGAGLSMLAQPAAALADLVISGLRGAT